MVMEVIMNLELLETKIYKALSHPIRLELVKKLTAGEKCVCDLFDDSEFTQPNISQHLKVLRNAGVLARRKQGTFYYYSVKQPGCVELIKIAQKMIKREIDEATAALDHK